MGKRSRDERERGRGPLTPTQPRNFDTRNVMSSSLTAANAAAAAGALYPRKRPSPNGTSSGMDGAPHAKRSNTAPVASTSSPVRPALRRTQAERELHALLEPEYRDEVRAYMYDLETRTLGSVELIDMQPELQWYMRPYLIDFLIEVHQQHGLRPETLYLAINIVDRYVSKRIVFKKHFQLVGCAALWIAAKFEDAKDRVPTVQELCQSCCGAYEESAFVQMEGHVLSTIAWVIGHPSAESWLRLACVQPSGVEDSPVQHLARFLMEVTLFHRGFISCKPSDIAAGALLLARFMLGRPSSPRKAGFLPSHAIIGQAEAATRIAHMLDAHFAEHLDHVSAILVKKYSYPCYNRTSTFAREWYLSGRRFQSATPASSPVKAPASSSPLYARGHASFADMSPSSDCSSSSESEAETDCDFNESPHTPITPLSSCSLVNPMDALATTSAPSRPRPPTAHGAPSEMQAGPSQKENLPRSISPPKRRVNAVADVMMADATSRPVLNDATWEANMAPIVPMST